MITNTFNIHSRSSFSEVYQCVCRLWGTIFNSVNNYRNIKSLNNLLAKGEGYFLKGVLVVVNNSFLSRLLSLSYQYLTFSCHDRFIVPEKVNDKLLLNKLYRALINFLFSQNLSKTLKFEIFCLQFVFYTHPSSLLQI